jgi:Spy/CpxP family protein refolding chaperone
MERLQEVLMFGQWRRMWFQGQPDRYGHGPLSLIARAGVQLSDEQVEKLAELRGDGMVERAGAGADMLPRLRDIAGALAKPDIDKDEVRRIHKEMQAKRNQLADEFVERLLGAAEILTAEQRKQVRLHLLRESLGFSSECDENEQRPRRGRH